MGRVLRLGLLGTLVLGAVFYGIVLNGFGLFGPSEPPRLSAESAAAPEVSVADDGGNASPSKAKQAVAAQSGNLEPATTAPADNARIARQADHSHVARDVTPPNVLHRPTSRYIDPALLAEQEPEPEDKPDVRRYHRIVVRDAATLEAGDVAIRLAGIAPIVADTTCTDDTGQSWPCGRVAAAALRMLIRQRAIDCAVSSETADGISGICSAGLQDINGWLVEQGWAEADVNFGGGADYTEQAETARAEKRGTYLAKWEPKGTGGTGLVPQAAFKAPEIPTDIFSSAPIQGADLGLAQAPVEPAEEPGQNIGRNIGRALELAPSQAPAQGTAN